MFGWLSVLGSSIGTVLGVGKTVVDGWQERKKAALESELAIEQAKTSATIKRLEVGQTADIAWEHLSIDHSGWKDEYLLILFSIPLIMCFVPGWDKYVVLGFQALDGTPDWYQWAIGIMVGSAYGYRKIADFMALKKGD